jgi:hypothetical protein
MSKRALIIGINEYDSDQVRNLSGCVDDAQAIADVLSRHEDGRVNFQCRTVTSPGQESPVTKVKLRKLLVELFAYDGDVALYFSGHGSLEETGGFIVAQDGVPGDPGLHMYEIVALANLSKARSVLLVLDCCHAGALANAPEVGNAASPIASLREGVTILAAASSREASLEINGQGVFTELVVGALKGGAANVRGHVSAAAVYGYVEAALGSWDQRPIYKSHAKRLEPIRECEPLIGDTLLRELPDHFAKPDAKFFLDPTYEEVNQCAKPENVAIFKKFKKYQIAGLLRNLSGQDLFWTAERSGPVMLTPLGQFYWRLAKTNQI